MGIRWWFTTAIAATVLLITCTFSYAVGRSDGRMIARDNGPTLSEKEYAAVKMIQLGFHDWLAACAWELGKSGRPRDEMFRACTVRFGIGEPEHPERRHPSTQG